jgi:hypothetical protein
MDNSGIVLHSFFPAVFEVQLGHQECKKTVNFILRTAGTGILSESEESDHN